MLIGTNKVVAVVLLVIALVAVAWQVGFLSSPPPPPAHVILISIDTLRADRLGAYGHERTTDPSLARFVEDAVLFETVASQASQTLLSHQSLFTAKHPLTVIRDTTNIDRDTLRGIPPEQTTDFFVDVFSRPRSQSLVETVQAGNYQTAAFTDGRWMQKKFGCGRGFELYNDEAGGLVNILPRATEWIAGNRAKPFFLFVHAYDVHGPYWCREPFNSRYCRDHAGHVDLLNTRGKRAFSQLSLTERDHAAIRDHYDGGIASADAYLGEFFDHLRKTGVYDDALIVVTSDHGEGLGEHDRIGHGGLYLEQLHVPLLIKFPASHGIGPARVGAPTELVDVMPTVLDICKLAAPPGVDGKSVMGAVVDGAPHRRFLLAQCTFRDLPDLISNPVKQTLWQPGQWLLIRDGRTRKLEVFDLAKDPRGFVDVADLKPAAIAPLLTELLRSEAFAPSRAFRAPERMEIDEETRRQLRALGYLK